MSDHGLAVTSIIVAILALLASAVSAVFSGRQVQEAKHVRQIEQGRRKDERQPRFSLELEPVNDGQWNRLWVVLTSSEALDSLTVTLLSPQLVWFPSGQQGIEAGEDRKVATWARVEPGVREVAWRVESEDDDGHRVRVGLEATAGADTWSLQLEFELPAKPYDILKSIY